MECNYHCLDYEQSITSPPQFDALLRLLDKRCFASRNCRFNSGEPSRSSPLTLPVPVTLWTAFTASWLASREGLGMKAICALRRGRTMPKIEP